MPTSGVTDLAGRVLAGRYRLLAPLGAGASGRVYVAEDVKLRRRVAVKVLHAALADDAGFLKRFRMEAQIAAALNHRNIVTVHDWGEDGVPFMVLELLEGGSLRSMLDRGVLLTPSQAAHVGVEVAGALEYAHARGLVHRDVKPANLLFDAHGIIRVADFGLARALAEASWTEPSGAVLGTARYAAPEQARGSALDGRADLYALALVLVESVTGSVPFARDTPLGTLAARLDEPIVAPRELGPLGVVVERAGRPDREERYQDATTMGAALFDIARRLPPPTPLPIGGGPAGDDPHPTEVKVSSALIVDGDSDPVVVTPARPPVNPVVARAAGAGRWLRNHAIPVAIIALLVIALSASAFAVTSAGASRVGVPTVVGRNLDSARVVASERKLGVTIDRRVTADDAPGTVLRQRPAAGSWMASGASIHVVISKGPPPIAVPSVAGQPEAQARSSLAAAGFEVAPPTHQFDDTVPKGSVISQSPAGGEQASRDTKVQLVISDGPKPVPVPNVVGQSYDDAVNVLKAAHLGVTRVDDFSDTIPVGQVISQDPAANAQAPRDSKVTLHVSKGPDLVTVPDVRNMKVEDASAALEQAGLAVGDVAFYSPGRRVKSQDPEGGKRVKRGTTVDLVLEKK
jgi:serine/threonine-protein kinase